jgi:hypothetical protein
MGCPQLCTGALLTCSSGLMPGSLNALPTKKVLTTTPAGNIGDVAPMASIPSFGLCRSLGNPATAAATAIASAVPPGIFVLVPMPCIPMVSSWIPTAPTTLVGGMPTTNASSTATCLYGGCITVSFPGQATVMV